MYGCLQTSTPFVYYRSDVFPFLDRVTYLCLGDVVYTGATQFMLEYFRGIGFPCPELENPLMYYRKYSGGTRLVSSDEFYFLYMFDPFQFACQRWTGDLGKDSSNRIIRSQLSSRNSKSRVVPSEKPFQQINQILSIPSWRPVSTKFLFLLSGVPASFKLHRLSTCW